MANPVAVVHPITGETLHLHPDLAASGVWLSPDPAVLDADTREALRAGLNIGGFCAALVGGLLPDITEQMLDDINSIAIPG